ncbi:uncharacterized protein LY89DRAFT_760222 [Mollisia scopiformis]|uniref:Uncharacterized protein n=1 Tax=Mollisia scopiformis TaxID=149040 RepID=A0A132BEG6_MOLSC|nr:uncharacterized protein LY89DRAFT_760222 [Mollisia scopiformis]KUJ10399.1 hypothetical protein LY89DRAFT_760222 [Mollisia scopiformis]
MQVKMAYDFTPEQLAGMLEFIEESLEAELWEIPKMNLLLLTLMRAFDPSPTYRPMSVHLQARSRLQIRTNDLNCPDPLLQMAKAAELIHPGRSDTIVTLCMPTNIQQFFDASYDTRNLEEIWKKAIRRNAKVTGTKMLGRAINVAMFYLRKELASPTFVENLKTMTDHELIEHFADMLDKEDIGYIYSEAWKAMSMIYVWHDGERPDAADLTAVPPRATHGPEESIRRDLRLYTKLGAGILIRHVLVDVVMKSVNDEDITPSSSTAG